MIDASAPGYGERRRLRDRVIEPEATPIVPATPLEPASNLQAQVQCVEEIDGGADGVDLQRPSPQTTRSEFAVGSGGRRKGPRRRVVDLARESSLVNQQNQSEIPQEIARPTSASVNSDNVSPRNERTLLSPMQVRADASSPQPQPQQPGIIESANLSPLDVSDKGRSLVSEIQSLNLKVNGEAYRQKIESLKSEVGSNWLSMLSEDGWNQRHLKPEVPAFRASSQAILSGSRTLG